MAGHLGSDGSSAARGSIWAVEKSDGNGCGSEDSMWSGRVAQSGSSKVAAVLGGGN